MDGIHTIVDHYVSMPHDIVLVRYDDGWHAECPQLRGCVAYGETWQEALEALADVKRAWMELAVERGWAIPAAGQ